MARHQYFNSFCLLTALLIGLGIAGKHEARALSPQEGRARAVPQVQPNYAPSTDLPDEVQLVKADTNPAIRIPVSHSSLNWTLIKPRIRASYGWLEIDRVTVRFTVVRPSRMTKEPDQGFDIPRSEVLDLKTEYNAAAFRARGLRHWVGFSPPNHWDAADSPDASLNSINKTDSLHTPLILRALQSFDSVVADLKLRQEQPVSPPPAPVQPTESVMPKPAALPPPPTLVLMAPSGASENQTIEVNESSLAIRGAAMDNGGLPTVTINGTAAALRPSGENAAEFWSDPITLKPGDTPIDIVATSPAKATSRLHFVIRFAPKAAPVNPRALGKDEIISLLQGSVPTSRLVELVRDRGIKFTPTHADLEDLRSAGADDSLLEAIRQAAPSGK
ncbi:MAG TPA: hypothetical protein VMO17_04720 [Terriglobia bacterium]|nr:hypothetical protein [Terriglobia bacterium]